MCLLRLTQNDIFILTRNDRLCIRFLLIHLVGFWLYSVDYDKKTAPQMGSRVWVRADLFLIWLRNRTKVLSNLYFLLFFAFSNLGWPFARALIDSARSSIPFFDHSLSPCLAKLQEERSKLPYNVWVTKGCGWKVKLGKRESKEEPKRKIEVLCCNSVVIKSNQARTRDPAWGCGFCIVIYALYVTRNQPA